MNTTEKGNLAVLKIAADLIEKGYKVAIPFGESCDYDLILCIGATFERVQVKYCRSNGDVLEVRAQVIWSNGSGVNKRAYTSDDLEWIAVYDATTKRCFYVPMDEVDDRRGRFTLRLAQPKNSQIKKIRWADNYLSI